MIKEYSSIAQSLFFIIYFCGHDSFYVESSQLHCKFEKYRILEDVRAFDSKIKTIHRGVVKDDLECFDNMYMTLQIF